MKEFIAEEKLQSLRNSIDNIDTSLIYMLAERFKCTDQIGILKAVFQLPAIDSTREDEQSRRTSALAIELNIDPKLLNGIFRMIIDEVVLRHEKAAQNLSPNVC